MEKTAKVFTENGSQAVQLPDEFRFSTSEVFIRKQGDGVILSARPKDFPEYLATAPVASADYMDDVEDLPLQEREFWLNP